MTPPVREQRNSYKGSWPRAWLRIQLVALGRVAVQDIDVLVDTGSTCSMIVSTATMARFGVHTGRPPTPSNFGALIPALLHLVIPDVGYDDWVEAYENDTAVAEAKKSSPDFEGLLGLPLLRQFEYGGDATSFWLRPAGNTP